MQCDVLVVGAGPVGLAAAFFLARQGVQVRIIDKAAGPAAESRAIGIQARTLEVLEMAGAVDEFVKLGQRLTGVTLHGEHGGKIGHVSFEGLPSRYRYILTLPQSDTERILANQLQRHGIQVERRTSLHSFTDDGNQVRAVLQKEGAPQEALAADWLVGADGPHSTVREALDIGFAGKTYDLQFLLADLHVDGTLPEDEAQVFGRAEGLLAIFPLGGGRYRLIADNPPGQFSPEKKPTLEEWQAVVDRRSSVPLRLFDPNWVAYFRVHARLAEHLRKGRAFLMGDAAHIHSPALAQGMNTGIQDAWNLAWKIALVERGGAAVDLLESYEAERLPIERKVLEMTDFVQNTIATESRFRQAVRDVLLPLAMHLPFLRARASETVSELAIAYRGSPIVEDHHAAGGPHAGDRAPDALMVDGRGGEVRLFSLFGRQHVLLVVNEAAGLIGEVENRFSQFVKVYTVRSGGDATGVAVSALRPKDDDFGNRYGKDSAYFLIRPDGYVALRTGARHAERVTDFLSKHFRTGA